MDGRRIAKRWAMSLAATLRLDYVLRQRLQRRRQAVIVNLHRVSPEANPFWPALDPVLFDDLLGYIGRHFHVTTLAEMAQVPDRPSLVLSFDDGYRDFLEYAVPILERHRMPANQNVVPACIESGRPPWNVALYDFLQAAPPALLAELNLPGFDRPAPDGDPARKGAYGLAVSRFLKNRPRQQREGLWALIEQTMQRIDVPYTPMLPLHEVRQLAHTYEIGCHSFSHESMGYEEWPFFEQDTLACRQYFHGVLGQPMTIYAFPNGSYRPEQVTFLHEQGVLHVLLVDERPVTPEATALPRLTLYGDSAAELSLRTCGLFAARGQGDGSRLRAIV